MVIETVFDSALSSRSGVRELKHALTEYRPGFSGASWIIQE